MFHYTISACFQTIESHSTALSDQARTERSPSRPMTAPCACISSTWSSNSAAQLRFPIRRNTLLLHWCPRKYPSKDRASAVQIWAAETAIAMLSSDRLSIHWTRTTIKQRICRKLNTVTKESTFCWYPICLRKQIVWSIMSLCHCQTVRRSVILLTIL